MFREKMDLRIKCLLLPFTELEFYHKDLIKELAHQKDTAAYQKFFGDSLLGKIYPILNRTSHIYNLDEVKLLLKKYYPHDKLYNTSRKEAGVSQFYLSYLSQLCQFFLTHRNGKIALKYWKSEDEDYLLGPYSGIKKVALWNSMDRMFTTEILVFLYLLRNGMDEEVYLRGYHSSVHLPDTQLEQVLSRGVAETHLHLNAGGNFSMNWLALMSPIENHYTAASDTEFYDQVIRKDIKLQPYIRAMVIVRILLAYYLYTVELQQTSAINLVDFYRREPQLVEGVSVLDFLECIYHGKRLENSGYDFDQIYQTLQLRYRLRSYELGAHKNWKRSTAKADIIHLLMNPTGEHNTVENFFVFKCIKYMLRKENDDVFGQLFWQYIRVKNETFQIYIQANMIRGLENFLPYYNRATEFSNQAIIIHHQLQNPYLRKLEVRLTTGMKSGEDKRIVQKKLANKILKILGYYKDMLKDIARDNRPIPELGFILHFIKLEDESGIEKCWLDFNPFSNEEVNTSVQVDKTKLFFKQRQEDYLTEMEAIRDLREEIPGLSDYIVGIDAASSEFAVEPWVFAPVFKAARNSTTHKFLYKNTEGQRIRNLGLTFHAGEDFRHLLTGIRRVHEVYEHFQFHAGDRIGHGIALGIDSQLWQKRNQVVVLPRIEHLENLLWVWGLYKDGAGMKVDATYLEQEILKQAEQIYKHMEGITVYSLWMAYRAKFKSFEVSEEYRPDYEDPQQSRLFCPYVKTNNIWNVTRLTHAQHCKCYLHPMMEPIEVGVEQEDLILIDQVQKIVREVISREGIVIEANPTSNTAIGEIENIFQHYILSLNQRGLKSEQSVENGIMITINTDDPVVFNTNINNEFAYMFYSLLEKGYSREDILLWINKIREQGIQSSFVETRQMSLLGRMKELDRIIKRLEEDYS